jgi:hypothetical protein
MNIQRQIRFCTAILFAFLCLASGRAAQTPLPPQASPAPAPFISAFNVTPGYGKDPFFPNSGRLKANPVIKTNIALPHGELPAGMVLKGISGTKDKPLAIINNYTFAEGEEADLRVGLGVYRVKVIEIKERSVMVSVNGSAPRELALRQGV